MQGREGAQQHCMECLWSLCPLHSFTTTVRPFNVALERVSVSVWARLHEAGAVGIEAGGRDSSGRIAMVLNL